MSSAIYPDPPRLVTAVCGHGEQQRLSNARLRLTFYNAPVAYCGPARPGSAFQQPMPLSPVDFGKLLIDDTEKIITRDPDLAADEILHLLVRRAVSHAIHPDTGRL